MIIIRFVTNTYDQNTDVNYRAALDDLYSHAEIALDANPDKDALSLYRLPAEFLEIFLDIPGRRGGFCIISPGKLVTFFDEEPDLITIIGKTRSKEQGKSQISSKALQLFKISFSKTDGGLVYKDNTGGILLPGDIVELIIRWAQA